MTGTTRFFPTYPTIPHIKTCFWAQPIGFRFGAAGSLFLQPVAELFDDRVGQYLPGNSFDLSLGRRPVHPAVQSDLKKLALADVANPLVAHLLKGAVDSLALGIENRSLEHHCDKSLHKMS